MKTTETTENTEKTVPRQQEPKDPLSEKVIGAAIEVHRRLGPGLVESLYEAALCVEFKYRNISFERQKAARISYRGEPIGEQRIDLLVEGELLIELKSVKALNELHMAQVLCYMKVLDISKALLINFDVLQLVKGLKRVVL